MKEVFASEFKSFYKSVQGNEGDKCKYNTRLDTYGCGCQHNCDYCYARSLLNFRGFWDSANPRVADIKKVKRKINHLQPGVIIRLGETVRKLRLSNPFVAKGLPSPQGMKFSIKPFEH